VVSATSSSTSHGGGINSSQRPSGQHASKSKANELTSSSDTFDPAKDAQRRALCPRPGPRLYQMSRKKKLQSVADNSGPRGKGDAGGYWPGR